jgi:hypothetical protein
MSSPPGSGIAIRSFRVVFDLERRIHKVDRIRLPLPYGLPLRSVAYAVAAFLAVLVLARLPLLGGALAVLPAPVRLAVLPALVSYLLTQMRPDGRPAHWFLMALARQRVARAEVVALAPVRRQRLERLGDVIVAPDERDVRLRVGVVEGPAVALLRLPVEARQRGRTLVLEQTGELPQFQGRRLVLDDGQRTELR